MPIHPLPIIVGTTLLVSGGIAFKKFVYDPHLAPLIEAFIANHTAQPPHPQAVPLQSDAPTYGHTSSRRQRALELRRRRRPEDYELRVTSAMPDLIPAQELPLPERSRDETTNPASHPLRPSRLPRPSQPRPSNAHVNPFLDMPEDDAPLSSFKLGQVGRTPAANNLINLDRPSSPQDAEIREVVFNLPPTPLRSVSPSSHADTTPRPGSTSHLPDHLSVHAQNDERVKDDTLPSTTFSFLSLSQASSPEVPNAALAQMSLSVASATEPWGEMSDFAPLSPAPAPQIRETSATSADVWARIDVPTLTANNLVRLAQSDGRGQDHTRDTRDEDVLSLAETSTSGYIDAESYTPGMLSPMRIHTAWSSPAGLPVSNDLLTERNLRAVDNIPPVSLGPIARARPGKVQVERREARDQVKQPRGTMSVVSLSESEGWGGDSDWEERSEAGMRQ